MNEASSSARSIAERLQARGRVPWLFELDVRDREHLLREVVRVLGSAVSAQLCAGNPAHFPNFLTITPRFDPVQGVRLEVTVVPELVEQVQRVLGAEWAREAREWGLRYHLGVEGASHGSGRQGAEGSP